MSLFSHSVGLFNLRPRRSHSIRGSDVVCPQLWAAESASESVVSPLLAAGTLCQSPALGDMVAQSKANGRDFDEFSTNIFCIYIYGQVRLTCLPKKISIYLCIKESIAPF